MAQELVFNIKVITNDVVESKKRIDDLTKEIKELSKAYDANKDAIKEKSLELAKEKQEYQQLTLQQKNSIKVAKDERETLNSLRAQLALNKQAIGNLTIEEIKNSDAGKKLIKDTDALNEKILSIEKSYGTATRQVGWYEKAQQGVNTALIGAAAVVGGAMAAWAGFEKVMMSTTATGDKFNAMMSGAKEATSALFKSIANGDWSNLLVNMENAYNIGVKYEETLDNINDQQDAMTVVIAQNNTEIARLNVIYRDSTKTLQERETALKQLLALEKTNASLQNETAWKQANNEQDRLTALTKLSGADLQWYNKKLATDQKLIDSADKLNKAESELVRLKGVKTVGSGKYISTVVAGTQAEIQAQNKLIAELKSVEDVQRAAQIRKQLEAKTDAATWKAYQDSLAALESSRGIFDENTRKQQVTFAQFQKEKNRLLQEEIEKRKILDAREADKNTPISPVGQKPIEEIPVEELPDVQMELRKLEVTQDQKDEAAKQDIKRDKDKFKKQAAEFEKYGSFIAEGLEILSYNAETNMQKELDAAGNNEKKKEEIRTKYANRQKAYAITQALINGALGITNAFATMVPTIPAAVIAAGLVTASTAAQVASIASQKFALGGDIKGQSHASGGVPIEAEGGEYIINKRSIASNDVLSITGTPHEIARHINGYRGYGRKYEMGGYVPAENSTAVTSSSTAQISTENNLKDLAKMINDKKVVQDISGLYKATNTYNVVQRQGRF